MGSQALLAVYQYQFLALHSTLLANKIWFSLSLLKAFHRSNFSVLPPGFRQVNPEMSTSFQVRGSNEQVVHLCLILALTN